MLDDYTVNIVYKNRALEPVSQKNYPLVDYCQEQKLNIMHTIADIENAFYKFQNNYSKEDWNIEAIECFQHIRHKLLDAANNIERIPRNLCFCGQNIGAIKSSEHIANLINQAVGENNQ